MIVSVCSGCGDLRRVRFRFYDLYYCVECAPEMIEYYKNKGEGELL